MMIQNDVSILNRSTVATSTPSADRQEATLFGLTPIQLHDRFWAARGVQVVRQGEASEIIADAEMYLLSDPRTLTIFKLKPLLEVLNWMHPEVLFVRLHDTHEHGYREYVVADQANHFIRFERQYDRGDSRLARVALTADLDLARMWQAANTPREGWRMLRHTVHRQLRSTRSVQGHVYDRSHLSQQEHFVKNLIQIWKHPDATIQRAKRFGDQTWGDQDISIAPHARVVGPVWIGAGRHLDPNRPTIGPVVLWDDPHAKPAAQEIHWLEIERTRTFQQIQGIKARQLSFLEAFGKRAFDLVFAIGVLTLTAPIFPIVMLLIFLEDGRPFFFGHQRETLGGKPFPCWKFRSMRKDAEQIKQRLLRENAADGPQFFIENDPRLTRVGRLIRKLNIDELPQFFNVLMGQMSVVGPRPSPFKENQFCPAWREARLSVKPGVTGLWQVRRSRLPGLDFQEWIRYDVQYVRERNWKLDLWIMVQTVKVILSSIFKSS